MKNSAAMTASLSENKPTHASSSSPMKVGNVEQYYMYAYLRHDLQKLGSPSSAKETNTFLISNRYKMTINSLFS